MLQLPLELHLLICRDLSDRELATLAATSKHFRTLLHDDAPIWSQRIREKHLAVQGALKADATKKHLSAKEKCLVLNQRLCWSCHAPGDIHFKVRVAAEEASRLNASTPSLASLASGKSRTSFASFDSRVSSAVSCLSFYSVALSAESCSTCDSDSSCEEREEKAGSKGFCGPCYDGIAGGSEEIYYRSTNAMEDYQLEPWQFRRMVPESVWVTEWSRATYILPHSSDEEFTTWDTSTYIIDGARAGRRRHVRPEEEGLFELQRPQVWTAEQSEKKGDADDSGIKAYRPPKDVSTEYEKASAYAVFWRAKHLKKAWRKMMRASHRAERDRRREAIEAWREDAAASAP